MIDCVFDIMLSCVDNETCIKCEKYISYNSTEGRLLIEEEERKVAEKL